MALTTIEHLITKSLQKLLGMNPGESPSSNMLSEGLDALNAMVDSFGIRDLLKVAPIRESFTLTTNKGDYTICSSGCDLTSARYVQNVESGFIRDSGNNDTSLGLIGRNEYDAIVNKSITGLPEFLFYDPATTQETTQTGTLYLYPVPDAAYTLFLNTNKGLAQYSATSDSLDLPPGYNRMLIYNLCVELAPDYGRQLSPQIAFVAKESKDEIMAMNAASMDKRANLCFPGNRRGANIYNGY